MKQHVLGKPRLIHGIFHLLLLCWSALVLFPIWIMVVNSFKKRIAIYNDPFGLPKVWNFDSYKAVFAGSDFIAYFWNSIEVTVISLAVILLFASLAAYAIVNWHSWVAKSLYLYLIAGMLVPIRIGSINLLNIIKNLGLLDSTQGLYPIYIAMGVPIGVFILCKFFRSLPASITEASIIDGASRFTIYSRILLPLTRPALGSVAIFNLVPIWNDLWFPLIFIHSDREKTLILGVTKLFGQFQTDWSQILAVLTLSAIPVMLIYLSMSKQFIDGLTAGAVKG